MNTESQKEEQWTREIVTKLMRALDGDDGGALMWKENRVRGRRVIQDEAGVSLDNCIINKLQCSLAL